MTEKAFDQDKAIERYAEIMNQHDNIDFTDEIEKLEIAAGIEGLRFVGGGFEPVSLQEMGDFEKQRFRSYHISERATESSDAVLWHVDVELVGTKLERRRYHVTIVDGDEKIDTIVLYGPNKLIAIEPYVHHEMDYTVHDGCDHEDDYCVLDDPQSGEYQDAEMEEKYHRAVQKAMNARSPKVE